MFYPVVMYISINTNVSGVNNSSSVSSYFVGDLVSLPRADKVDALWMKSIGFSLRHLIGFLVLHLHK